MATHTLANNAAAVAAGWTRLQWENVGTGTLTSRYSKYLTGDGDAGHTQEIDGSGATQVAADTAALAALNAFRINRYGADTTATSKGVRKGAALTLDAS
jgi:hypothetical protein